MNGWENFFLAEVGAAAALAGLIFVGVSINLNRIMSIPKLPNRAFEALLLLLTILVVCSLMLVPGQPIKLVGCEILFIGMMIWVTITFFDLKIFRHTDLKYRLSFAQLIALHQVILMSYVIAGTTILWRGPTGFYWLVPAILFSFIKAILDAWVLLVEINR